MEQKFDRDQVEKGPQSHGKESSESLPKESFADTSKMQNAGEKALSLIILETENELESPCVSEQNYPVARSTFLKIEDENSAKKTLLKMSQKMQISPPPPPEPWVAVWTAPKSIQNGGILELCCQILCHLDCPRQPQNAHRNAQFLGGLNLHGKVPRGFPAGHPIVGFQPTRGFMPSIKRQDVVEFCLNKSRFFRIIST